MEDAFHPSGSKDFIERKKGEEDQGEETPGGFLAKHVGPKDKLGVPRNYGLIEVK